MDEKERNTWQIILRFGFLGGVVSLYFCVIGMVETFSQRYLIGDFISVGDVLLAGGLLGGGFLAARELKNRSFPNKLFGPFGSGLIGSILLVLLVIILFGREKGVIQVSDVLKHGPAARYPTGQVAVGRRHCRQVAFEPRVLVLSNDDGLLGHP